MRGRLTRSTAARISATGAALAAPAFDLQRGLVHEHAEPGDDLRAASPRRREERGLPWLVHEVDDHLRASSSPRRESAAKCRRPCRPTLRSRRCLPPRPRRLGHPRRSPRLARTRRRPSRPTRRRAATATVAPASASAQRNRAGGATGAQNHDRTPDHVDVRVGQRSEEAVAVGGVTGGVRRRARASRC